MGTTGMGASRLLGGRAALAGVLITTALTPILAAGAMAQMADVQTPGAQTASSEPGAERAFDIPAQPLSGALVQFGRQSGLQVSVDGALVRDLQAPAVEGVMRNEEALRRLLSGTGLVASRTDARTLMIRQAAGGDAASGGDPIFLDTLVVEGRQGGIVQETGAERDARKADEIFDLNLSTDYTGKDEVERYKGISVADVLQGLTNVYSGDARNGGALDANIRGIQGAGRSPVIIDGTEQALVVWRGYNGVSNRSYVDPSLIAGVQVLKGPASVREVNSQIGGAIVIDTLDAGDILEPGEVFGVELRLEGGNNSTDPRLPTLSTGLDYREVDGIFGEDGMTGGFFDPVADTTLRVEPRTEDDNDVFSLGDRAARIAVAGRPRDDIEIFAAYAYRERGNYFAGANNTDFYTQDDLPNQASFFMQRLALTFEPGNEVTNSSSELESWLFKSTWRIADDQIIQLGYRNTRSEFGEILPSRLFRSDLNDNNSIEEVQWPLSRTRNQALNLEYKYAPETPWLDLHANLWMTRGNSDTYSAGGYPNVPTSRDDPTLINTAVANARGNRFGITASNKIELLPSLDITIGGHYQFEKLRSDDELDDLPDGHRSFRQFPREGRRQEYRADFEVEWRPTDFLTFNGGVSRAGYWVFDDGLQGLLEGGRSFTDIATVGQIENYDIDAIGLEAWELFNSAPDPADFDLTDPFGQFAFDFFLQLFNQAREQERVNPRPFRIGTFSVDWLPDENGNFRRADTPVRCEEASLGDFDLDAVLGGIAAATSQERGQRVLSPVVRSSLSGIGCASGQSTISEIFILNDPGDVEAMRGGGWEPYVSATLNLSDDIRVYARYAELLRFPSMFESTLGFSASVNLAQPLEPERIQSYEVAYIQDFSRLFGLDGDQRADFKLVYFHNTVNNVIERGDNLRFFNLDRQVIDGLELQARIDTGEFFFDFGAARILTNETCDESRAAVLDFNAPNIDVPDCINFGFLGGYLLTQAIPTQTVNATLGGRFFDRRLELGTRTTYFSEYDNPQLEEFVTGEDRLSGFSLNVPYAFGETLVFDAYARFNFSDRLTAEIVSTNITDQFFADPLSRSLVPAPGRQVRLSVTGRL